MTTVTSDFEAFLGDDLVLEMPEAEETVEQEFEAEEVEEHEEDEVVDVEEDDEDDLDEDFDDDEENDDDLDEDKEVDEDEEAEEAEQTDEFELTVDGELVKVTKEELTSGYLRNKDYLAKVAEAEQRIEVLKQEEATLMKSQEVFAFSSLKQLEECEKAIEAEGGWLAIERNRDPIQVAQFKEMYQNIQNQAKLAETVQAEFKAKQEASYEADMVNVAKHLIKTIPNMTKETFSEMDAYIMEMGLPEEYARTIRNPVAWSMIHKAMMYDKAQVRKVAAPEKAPKRVKKSIATRKEAPVASSRRKLDKTIDAMKKTTDRSVQRELATSAFAAFIN